MTLELSPEEREILQKLVDREISEVGPEIRHTQTSALHDELKRYREVLISLAHRLSGEGRESQSD
jgi:hypothetical protein